MLGRMTFRGTVCALAAVVALAGVVPAYAETQGGERRDDRRDDRDAGRDAKQDCKAGDENSRAECRQEKRDVKHGGGEPAPAAAPGAAPARQRQGAGVFLAEILTDRAQTFGVLQHPVSDFNNDPARFGQIDDPFAVPDENLHPQLVFQEPDLLTDPRLRRVQRLRGLRHIQAATHDFPKIAELLEFHGT